MGFQLYALSIRLRASVFLFACLLDKAPGVMPSLISQILQRYVLPKWRHTPSESNREHGAMQHKLRMPSGASMSLHVRWLNSCTHDWISRRSNSYSISFLNHPSAQSNWSAHLVRLSVYSSRPATWTARVWTATAYVHRPCMYSDRVCTSTHYVQRSCGSATMANS